MFFRIQISIFILILTSCLFSQSKIDVNLNQNRSALKQIEAQIKNLRYKIESKKKAERSIQQQIELLNNEMALIQRSKGILEREINLLNKKITNTQQELVEAEKRLNTLKELYAQRALYAYKYGHERELESLLTAHSLNQALIRIKYLQQIANHDKNLINLIQQKKEKIKKIQAELKRTLLQKNQTLNQIQQKEKTYQARKLEKQRLLNKIKWTRKTYITQLEQKKHERERLLNIIASLEQRRKSHKQPPAPKEIPLNFKFLNLSKAKGKLFWPVKGKVITHYGKQRDPKSKTYIKNTDIEIKAKVGTPVRCVFPGIVRVITYLPGYGNTVIIDHGKGYYTVYSHLGEIYVFKNSYVNKSQIIGKVGDSGYLGKTSLRFGIYGSNRTYDPERWLE